MGFAYLLDLRLWVVFFEMNEIWRAEFSNLAEMFESSVERLVWFVLNNSTKPISNSGGE